jgi:hypothetical protein
VDVDLARRHANMPEYDQELCKKLWLRIARHVIEEEKDVKKYCNLSADAHMLGRWLSCKYARCLR